MRRLTRRTSCSSANNYFRNVYPFNTNVGGQYAISAASGLQDRAHIIGAQLVTTFSPSLYNEFRGSWPYRNEHMLLMR